MHAQLSIRPYAALACFALRLQAVATRLHAHATAMAARSEAKRVEREGKLALLCMDERELRDIGLSASDVQRMVPDRSRIAPRPDWSR